MKNTSVLTTAIVAAAMLAATPAYATGKYPPPPGHHGKHFNGKGHGHAGKFIVGCVMGSALGAIGAAWRVSRTENRELTHAEAAAALSWCGLGSFAVVPGRAQPPVVTKY